MSSEFDDPFYDPDLEESGEETTEEAIVPTVGTTVSSPYDYSSMDEVTDGDFNSLMGNQTYGAGYDQFGNVRTMSSTIFREGERVKVIGVQAGHGIPIGTILTVRGYSGTWVQVYENGMSYYETDLAACPYRLEDAERMFNKTEAEYIHAKARLDYMKETGVKELAEAHFRRHMLTQIVSSGDSMEEKAKKIDAIYSTARK